MKTEITKESEEKTVTLLKNTIALVKNLLTSPEMAALRKLKEEIRSITDKHPAQTFGEHMTKKYPELIEEMQKLDEEINHFFGT